MKIFSLKTFKGVPLHLHTYSCKYETATSYHKRYFCGWYCLRNRNKANKGLQKQVVLLLRQKNIKLNLCCYHAQISLKMSQQTQSDIFHTKCCKMHCGVRLHGRNACYVIFWNIAPKHWIDMDRGYCNSFYLYLWLYDYWWYVIECDFAVKGI